MVWWVDRREYGCGEGEGVVVVVGGGEEGRLRRRLPKVGA